MKKLFIAACAVAMAGVTLAAEAKKEELSKLTPEQRAERRTKIMNEKHGGLITVKGTPSGSVVVVNAQKKVGTENFTAAQLGLERQLRGIVKVVDGEAATPASASAIKEKYSADFALFVVDDKALPPSLVAVEARWAILNVAGLEPGAATPEVLRIRTRNEFARVFALLCGAISSQFPSAIVNKVKTVSDLDSCLPELPVDVQIRLTEYLELCGVRPEKKVPYRKACQEGWAPEPTNDVQKAVWKQVHEMPKKPLKLEK